MNLPSIETTRKRTERYWYEDGIWEIGFGLINLLLAGYFGAAEWVLANRLPAPVLAILQMATLLGIFWLMARVVRFLKERITYPRTGYVAYRRGPLKQRARRVLLISLVSGGLAAALVLISASSTLHSSTPIITGVVMSGMIVYLAVRFNLLRMYGLAVLTLAFSIITALLPVSETSGRVLFFGSYGLVFLLSGCLVLAGYLRRTQPLAETPDYEAPAGLEDE